MSFHRAGANIGFHPSATLRDIACQRLKSTQCGHSLARPLPARAPKRELSQSRI
jgi:hypothetical protein